VYVVSSDEKTGIQALERKQQTRPMIEGQVALREFEYIRHGTQALLASFSVATGHVIASSVGPTRTEEDFANHIEAVITCNAQAAWIFVVDQLNTHKSEALVKLVARHCGLEAELGVKGQSGILQSMPSRAAFLSEERHRIRFVYTPKHCSWLNQIEIWFSILVRKLLRRGSFRSTEELKARIEAFILYFNRTMARAFKWTYKGRPLQA
jgi:transposase